MALTQDKHVTRARDVASSIAISVHECDALTALGAATVTLTSARSPLRLPGSEVTVNFEVPGINQKGSVKPAPGALSHPTHSGWRKPFGRVSTTLLLLLVPTVLIGQSSDVTPPKLKSLTISPNMIDTTTGPKQVKVTAKITDDLSGVAEMHGIPAYCNGFLGPSGNARTGGFSFQLTSGNNHDGIYTGTSDFPPVHTVWNLEYRGHPDCR